MKPSPKLPRPPLDGFGESELADVDARCAHVLRMRSGIGDGRRRTLKEIGEELGVGLERVRQLERNGLTAIREAREVQRHLRPDPTRRARNPRGTAH